MAYEDWPEEFQEIWDELPVDFDELSPSEQEYAEYMFEEGFMHYHGKMSPEDISFAREEFWDMIGEEFQDSFDWEAWREAMYP